MVKIFLIINRCDNYCCSYFTFLSVWSKKLIKKRKLNWIKKIKLRANKRISIKINEKFITKVN